MAIPGRPQCGKELRDSRELSAANNHVHLEENPVPAMPLMRLLS